MALPPQSLAKQKARCGKKVRYETFEAANFFGKCDGLRAYPCPICRGFHLTSKNVRKAHAMWRRLS